MGASLLLFVALTTVMAGETGRLQITRSVKVGSEPYKMIAWPKAHRLYVANHRGASVSVIDTNTLQVLKTIPVGQRPASFAFSDDGSTLFVGCKGGGLFSIDTKALTVRQTAVKGVVTDLAVDGHRVYMTMEEDGLKWFDSRTGAVTVMRSQRAPEGLAISADRRSLYVNYQGGGPGGSWGHDAIGVFDLATGRLTGSIAGFPNVGREIAVSPDGSRLWANGMDACTQHLYDHVGCPLIPAGTVNVIDAASRKHIRTLALAGPFIPESMVFTPDETRVVLTGTGGMLAVNSRTFQITDTFRDNYYGAIVFHPQMRRAYVALMDKDQVAEVAGPFYSGR